MKERGGDGLEVVHTLYGVGFLLNLMSRCMRNTCRGPRALIQGYGTLALQEGGTY